MKKMWLKNANRLVFAIFVLLGSVALRSQVESTEIGKDVTGDIKVILKPSFMEILASSEIVSWDEFKTRFQRIKEATSNFETKYKNQLTGSALDIAAQVPASVPSPAQIQAIQPAVQAPVVQQPAMMANGGQMASASVQAPQPMAGNMAGQIAAAPAISSPAIIQAPVQDLAQMQNTSVMTPPAQIQAPAPVVPVPVVQVPVAPVVVPVAPVIPVTPAVQVTAPVVPVTPVAQAPLPPVAPVAPVAPVVQVPVVPVVTDVSVAPVAPVIPDQSQVVQPVAPAIPDQAPAIQPPTPVAPVVPGVPVVQAPATPDQTQVTQPVVPTTPDQSQAAQPGAPAPDTSSAPATTSFFSGGDVTGVAPAPSVPPVSPDTTQPSTDQVIVGDVSGQPAPLPIDAGQVTPDQAQVTQPVVPVPASPDQTSPITPAAVDPVNPTGV